jgi:acetyltransferase-like isoleucine patch superfamily enzyme/glycosyltransferase involved in cell wall biosynthesis
MDGAEVLSPVRPAKTVGVELSAPERAAVGGDAMRKPPRIAIVYHMFPHYRTAVMRSLDESAQFRFVFAGSFDSFNGVEPMDARDMKAARSTSFVTWGPLYWQSGLLGLALSRKLDGIIFLGNPNFVSTWIAALLARLSGKKVLFWSHGWLKPEPRVKRIFRHAFYRIAHLVLVYGERAKQLGVRSGFPRERIEVIYNSLDRETSRSIVEQIERGTLTEKIDLRALFLYPDRPLVICTARLTPLCRFDLLFEAASLLKKCRRPINIVLVGDGPERPRLEALARAQELDVHFWGACYDEKTLGQLIYHSDITCSPGKIGLTAIHSLSYGTPAITHSDMDEQMPEVEAIVDGVTGFYFERNNAADLAEKIRLWIDTRTDRRSVRLACYEVIDSKWNPQLQRVLIEGALRRVAPGKANVRPNAGGLAREPMRVSEATIERCRREVESARKRTIRSFIQPIAKWYFGLEQVGEGFQFGWNLKIGPGTRVGRYAYIGSGFEANGPVTIGDLCMLSTHVKVVGNDHGVDEVGTPTRLAFRREPIATVLEADVWIGKGAFIRAGVTIGRGAVVAAGAVVTGNVKPYSIVAGVPARLLRDRFSPEQLQRHEAALFGGSGPCSK